MDDNAEQRRRLLKGADRKVSRSSQEASDDEHNLDGSETAERL